MSPEAAGLEGPVSASFLYGLDTQTRQPWRVNAADKKGRKEFGSWAADDADSPALFASAAWPDGDVHEISQVTKADLKSWLAGAKSNSSNGYWSDEHVVTHHRLAVRRRADRTLLVALFEQHRQVVLNSKHMLCRRCCRSCC